MEERDDSTYPRKRARNSFPSDTLLDVIHGVDSTFSMRNVLLFLFGVDCPALVRNNSSSSSKSVEEGELVDANDVVKGKVVMVCHFSLPLSSEAVAIAHAVSLLSSELHSFGAFELILLVDELGVANCKGPAYSDFVSHFPPFCLLLPPSVHFVLRPTPSHPIGLLINRAPAVKWEGPLDLFLRFGVDAFPFTPERLSWTTQREERTFSCNSWHTLSSFLTSQPLNPTFLCKGGVERVDISHLDWKCVGLYLCQTGNLIPSLEDIHKKYSCLGVEFEIVLVYMPFNDFADPQLFQDCINSTLRDRNISWWVVPFVNWVSRRLSRISQLLHYDSHDDRLIIIDPISKSVELHGEAAFIQHFGSPSAYPYSFSRELLVTREVERLRAVTLKSLLVYGSINYLLSSRSDFLHRVPVTELRGKNVLLYLHYAKDHSSTCFDKLVLYCQTMALDPNFESVFVGLDTTSFPDTGSSCAMPWLVLPSDPKHSDFVTRTIFSKGGECSTVISIGIDGRISSLRALRRVCFSCPGFPLNDNPRKARSAESSGNGLVEERNHRKALLPLLGEEYFFPDGPLRGRVKPPHFFVGSIDEDEWNQYFASKIYDGNVLIEPAQYPEVVHEKMTKIDTSNNFDVVSFLSVDHKIDYLFRNDGSLTTRFKVESLGDKKWVMICCFSCPVFFNSSIRLTYYAISDVCSELYEKYGDSFEMVLVVKMSRDFEVDDVAFRHMLSGFPSSCLVVPFHCPLSRDSICYSLGFSSSPMGLFLRVDERDVIWHKSLSGFRSNGIDTFPFTLEDYGKICAQERKIRWKGQSLEKLFRCRSTECVLARIPGGGGNYYEKTSIEQLQLQSKIVGVYLCFTGDSIPMLHWLCERCKADDIEFEIVVVLLPFRASNSNPKLFEDEIKSVLTKWNASWWVLPYKGWVSRRLERLMIFPVEEELIIVGNGVVDPDGAYFIRKFKKYINLEEKPSSATDGSKYAAERQSLVKEFKDKYVASAM